MRRIDKSNTCQGRELNERLLKAEAQISMMAKRVFALSHPPKFLRGDRVNITASVAVEIVNGITRFEWKIVDTGTVLYHKGNDGYSNIYEIDLNGGMCVGEYKEYVLELIPEAKPEKEEEKK